MRKKKGDHVVLFDGGGRTVQAEIVSLVPGAVDVRVLGWADAARPAGPKMLLAVGIVSADSLAIAVHAAVPAGIDEFIPVIAERSQWGRKSVQGKKLVARLERVAEAACCQSECAFLPRIAFPARLEDVLSCGAEEAVFGSTAPGTPGAASVFSDLASRGIRSLLLLVGPEGGFTGEEAKLALKSGAKALRMAPHVLRTEYAACLMAGFARNLLWPA